MKTFEERMAAIREKSTFEARKRKNRRILAGTLVSVFVITLALMLFVPYSTALSDISMYADSPYYKVIQELNQLKYTPPRYKNNFQFLASTVGSLFAGNRAPSADMNGPVFAPEGDGLGDVSAGVPNEPGSNYEEVTDNQVAGVIEADLFKRSDKNLFYLSDPNLYVYSIAQADSTLVGSHCIQPFEDMERNGTFSAREMYLSEDCSTIVVLMEGYTKEEGSLAALVTLDVTDPSSIRQTGFVTFKGSYISSRLVDGDILLTYNFGTYMDNIDFAVPETYIPSYGTAGNMQLIDGSDIICPQDVSACKYTVIAKLNSKSLEVQDIVALMGYSQELYVSEDTIYATHAFAEKKEDTVGYWSETVTEITGISFTGNTLEVLGSVQIAGSVKDQYSMDQFDGILRVAASTVRQHRKETGTVYFSSVQLSQIERNCSLYCIDLSTWEIAAAVENFAPDGDEVTSVRFDGSKAYICTAEVIELTDPVYFFELTNIHSITWTDTGIIDGYSSSLVNFGEYLLGIGFNEDGALKLEAYVQGKDIVESVGVYERDCSFPSEYKAYLIDRENHLVGIPAWDWYDHDSDGECNYLLLHFDGYEFNLVKEIPMSRFASNQIRATIIDGWLYLLYGNQCVVEEV